MSVELYDMLASLTLIQVKTYKHVKIKEFRGF